MKPNSVKQALKAGRLQLGTGFQQFRSVEVPRILAAAGFHWTFIDMEHGNFDLETVQDLCRVSNLTGLCPIVRVGELQYTLVARALDNGAQGIIFPRVESPEVLAEAIRWTKFPPVGIRGFGLTTQAVDYEPLTVPQIIEHFNANVMVVLQIETKLALERREELIGTPGVDVVLVGPADLSISLGVPGDFMNPKLIEAVDSIRETCVRHGVVPGMQLRNLQLAQFWRDRGMLFLGCSSEAGMLLEKAKEIATGIL